MRPSEVHAAKARVAVDLEQTAESFQVSGGVLALPVFAVNISGRRVTWAAPGSRVVVATPCAFVVTPSAPSGEPLIRKSTPLNTLP